MKFSHSSLLIAALALLGACGEGAKEPAAPTDAAVTVAPPTAAETTAMADAVATAGDEASVLYTRACAGCHGVTAEGVGDFPSLAKLSVKDVESRLRAYRAGETVGPKSALMAPLAKPLSDEQIAALALYLGS